MKRYLLAVAMGGFLFLNTSVAWGQFMYPQRNINPTPAPSISPYLNLVRPGGIPAFNYLTLVQPELQIRNQQQQFQMQFGQTQQQINTLNTNQKMLALPPTGHQAGFMTHTRYFMNMGGSGGGGMGVSRFGTAGTSGGALGVSRFGSAPTGGSVQSSSPFSRSR